MSKTAVNDPEIDKKSTGSGNSIKSSSVARNSANEVQNTLDQRKSTRLPSHSIVNTSREGSVHVTSAHSSIKEPSVEKSTRASAVSGVRRESASSKHDTTASIPPPQSKRASASSDSRRESTNSKKSTSAAATTPQQSVRGSVVSDKRKDSVTSKRDSQKETDKSAANSQNPSPNPSHSSSIKDANDPVSNQSILVGVLSASHQGSSKHLTADQLPNNTFIQNAAVPSCVPPLHCSSTNEVPNNTLPHNNIVCQNTCAAIPPRPVLDSQIDIDDPHTSLAKILFDETDIEPIPSAELIFSRGDEKPKSYLNIIESAANDLLQVIDKLNGAVQTEDNCSLLSVKSQLNCLHTKLVDQSNNQKQKKTDAPSNVILNQKTRNVNEYQEQRIIDGNLRTFKKKDIHHIHEKIIGQNPTSLFASFDCACQRQLEPDICTLSSAQTVFRRNDCKDKCESAKDKTFIIIKPSVADRNKTEGGECSMNGLNCPNKSCGQPNGNCFNQNGLMSSTACNPNKSCQPGFGRTLIVDPAVNKSCANKSANQHCCMSQYPENNKTQTCHRTNQMNNNQNDLSCTLTGYEPGSPPFQLCCMKCNQNNLPPCTIVNPNQGCEPPSYKGNDKSCPVAGYDGNNSSYKPNQSNQPYQPSSTRNDKTFTIAGCGPNNQTYQVTERSNPYVQNPNETCQLPNGQTYIIDPNPYVQNPNETYQIPYGQTYIVDPVDNRSGVGQTTYSPTNRTVTINECPISGPSQYKSKHSPNDSTQPHEMSYNDFSDALVSTPSSPHTPSLNSTMQPQSPEDFINTGINNGTFTTSNQFDSAPKRKFEDFFQIQDTTPPEFSTFYNTLTPDIQNATFNVSSSTNRASLEHNFYQTQAVYNLIQEAFQTEPFNIWVVQNFFNMVNGLKGFLGWNDILLCIADNIGEFTAIKIFNRLTFSELGHFNLSRSDMEEIYKCGLLDLFQYVRNRNLQQDPMALDQFTPSVARMIQADIEEPGKQSSSKFLVFVKVFIKFSFYIVRKIEFRKIFWKFFVGPSFDEPAMELLYNVQNNLKSKIE